MEEMDEASNLSQKILRNGYNVSMGVLDSQDDYIAVPKGYFKSVYKSKNGNAIIVLKTKDIPDYMQ